MRTVPFRMTRSTDGLLWGGNEGYAQPSRNLALTPLHLRRQPPEPRPKTPGKGTGIVVAYPGGHLGDGIAGAVFQQAAGLCQAHFQQVLYRGQAGQACSVDSLMANSCGRAQPFSGVNGNPPCMSALKTFTFVKKSDNATIGFEYRRKSLRTAVTVFKYVGLCQGRANVFQ